MRSSKAHLVGKLKYLSESELSLIRLSKHQWTANNRKVGASENNLHVPRFLPKTGICVATKCLIQRWYAMQRCNTNDTQTLSVNASIFAEQHARPCENVFAFLGAGLIHFAL